MQKYKAKQIKLKMLNAIQENFEMPKWGGGVIIILLENKQQFSDKMGSSNLSLELPFPDLPLATSARRSIKTGYWNTYKFEIKRMLTCTRIWTPKCQIIQDSGLSGIPDKKGSTLFNVRVYIRSYISTCLNV